MSRTSSATARAPHTRRRIPESYPLLAALWVAEKLANYAPRVLGGLVTLNERWGPPRTGIRVKVYRS